LERRDDAFLEGAYGAIGQERPVPMLLAPAKINVTLEILGRRSDGYHTLRSVMLPIGLYDRIVLEPAANGSGSFTVDDVALAEDNLVMRALALARDDHAYDVRLEKHIPVGGGLGGGSSDAASVLRAAMSGALGTVASLDWNAAARQLGSDVPFFLAGTGALVEGTGERVTPIGTLPPWWAIVVRPHASVPTARAYGLIAELRERTGPPPTRPRSESISMRAVDALQRADFAALQATLDNDFHEPILAAYPQVAAATRALEAAGAERPLLSGSGSCVFALFETEAQARGVLAAFDARTAEATFAVPFHHDAAWR
jgi:4-diphosphocytidyl-2-C-methyl-D-erythritol kinase